MPETTDLYDELVCLDSRLFQAVVASEGVDDKKARWERGEGKFLDGTRAFDLACDALQKCGGDAEARDCCLRQIFGSAERFSLWGPEVVAAVREELIAGIKERLAAVSPDIIQLLECHPRESGDL